MLFFRTVSASLLMLLALSAPAESARHQHRQHRQQHRHQGTHSAPVYTVDIDPSEGFTGIPAPNNKLAKEQMEVDAETIVKSRAARGNIRPISSIPIEHCNIDRTDVYSTESTLVITQSDSKDEAVTTVYSTAYISCLRENNGIFGPHEHLYDIQVFDVSIETSKNRKSKKTTKLENSAFMYATRFSRDREGNIMSIFFDERETRDVLRIKKNIIQSLQTQFEYRSGFSQSVQKDLLSEHNVQYFAVADQNSDNIYVESRYSKNDVLRYTLDSRVDDSDVDFTVYTKTAFADNKMKQQLARTVTTSNEFKMIGSSDTSLLYSLTREPAKQRTDFFSLFGDMVQIFFHESSWLPVPMSLVEDKSKNRKLPVPRFVPTSQSARTQEEQEEEESEDDLQLSVESLENYMLENDLLYSPVSVSRRFGKRDSNEVLEEVQQMIDSVRNLESSDEILTKLSVTAQNDPEVADIILANLKAAYINFATIDDASAEGVAKNRFIGSLAAALASSGNNNGYEYLLQLSKQGDDHARAALTLNGDNSQDQFVIRAHEELPTNEDTLIIGSLLANKEESLAQRIMSARLAKLESTDANEETKLLIIHSIKNMGSNSYIFHDKINAMIDDERSSSLVKREAAEAVQVKNLEKRGWFGADGPKKDIIRPTFDTNTTNFDWLYDDRGHNLISTAKDRRLDAKEYPEHSSYVAYNTFGNTYTNLELTAGAFAGLKRIQCIENESKVFARAVANLQAFGNTLELADVILLATEGLKEYRAKAIMKVMGKIVKSKAFEQECFSGYYPFGSIRTPLISKRFYFPVYSTLVDVGVAIQGGISASLRFETCDSRQAAIAIIPEVAASVAGSAGASVFEARVGIDIGGETSGALAPQASIGTIKGTETLSRVPGSNPIDGLHLNSSDIAEPHLEETPLYEEKPKPSRPSTPEYLYDPFVDGPTTNEKFGVSSVKSATKKSSMRKRIKSVIKASSRRFNPFSDSFLKRRSVDLEKRGNDVYMNRDMISSPKRDPNFKEGEICRACVSLNFAFDPSDLVVRASISIPMVPPYYVDIYTLQFNNRPWGPVQGSVRCSDKL